MEREIHDVAATLTVLSQISSYFHTSGVRTNELKNIAENNNLKVLSMPKIFKIRWSEYIYRLVRAVLTSWNALVLYFQNNEKCAKSSGFLQFITNEHTLRKICFIGDILFIFMRLQKKLQGDSVTLIKMCSDVKLTLCSLTNLIEEPLLGGFESKLNNSVEIIYDRKFLKKIERYATSTSRRVARLEEDGSTAQDLRAMVCESLKSHLSSRLEIGSDFLEMLQSFVSLDKSTDLKRIHEYVKKDLDLLPLSVQCNDLAETSKIKDLSHAKLVKFLTSAERFDDFKEVTIVLSRILACTPHPSDVERSISANNLLKTSQRSNLSLDTENYYLYVHFNMPALEKWSPMPAITAWLNETSRRDPKISISSGKAKHQLYFNI